MDRQAGGLAAPIPQGAIDHADRLHRDAFAPVDGVSIHQIPQALTRDRVGVLQQPAQFAIDDIGDTWVDRAAETTYALIGLDLYKDGLDRVAAILDQAG